MKWEPKGYGSAKLVDKTGLIVGDVEYRVAHSEYDASLRNPLRHLGTYTKQDLAQAAVERAVNAGVKGTPAPLADEAFVGWKLVPIQPTMAMLDAADFTFQRAKISLAGFNARELAYKALLDAAPPHGVPVLHGAQQHE